MGYNIRLVGSHAVIRNEDLDEAYRLMCELNAHDELKNGYSSVVMVKPIDSKSVSNSPDKWFSWMQWNYDETLNDAAGILEQLGFYLEEDDNNLTIVGYDRKIGDEIEFINSIGHLFVNTESDPFYLEWRGEDNAHWRNEFIDGKLVTKYPEITWK